MEGSDGGSMQEEEYTTALPAFSKDASNKERKERSFRIPFQRRRKDKEKEKGKDRERDRSAERSESGGRGGGSAMGEYGSSRARTGAEGAEF